MVNTFEYSVIRVEPDIRRGERVNVGIVVFNDGKLDIRVVETRKAAAIASKDWDGHIHLFSQHLKQLHEREEDPTSLIGLVGSLSKQISLTDTGWFEASSAQEYEIEVNRIIASLIKRPARVRHKREASIAVEIAAGFRSAKILSAPDEDLSSGKVIRNFVVDEEAGLLADFALKNGSLHLATTLNLTASNPHIGSTARQAITLDLAKRSNEGSKAYGVYAVTPSRKTEVKEHIAIFGDYSDDIFNWYDPEDKVKFKRVFYNAYNSNFPDGIDLRAKAS